jgi:uncharacterized protein with von Willebrand factor type A (vWA) domain
MSDAPNSTPDDMSETELSIVLLSEIANDQMLRASQRQTAREYLKRLARKIEVKDLLARCRADRADETRDRMAWQKFGS